jgi:filamentous hemagglutinin family protein
MGATVTVANSAQSAIRTHARARLMRRTALGGVLLVMANSGVASALPRLAGVPASVTRAPVITSPNANTTAVSLKQSRTLIDWSSFNVSQGEQVNFVFQHNNWIVLNRVNSLAKIDGKLLGCVITCGAGGSIGGNVWIYSPNGVIFGQHAQVNVGGLLATTSPLMSEKAFLDGSRFDFKFGGGPADAAITVQSGAQILTQGSLALISPSVVTETGSMLSAGGTALYGAAENYVVHFDETAGHGLNLVDFEVPASALTDGTISATPLTLNGQTAAGKVIIASVSRPSVARAIVSLGGMVTASSATDAGGGDIILSATGAPAAIDVGAALRASRTVSMQASDGGSINVSGAISAGSASGAGGAISLGGVGTGAVNLSAGGRLDASATGAGQAGGSVVLTAGAVNVDGAISATGPAGGGTILVGGGAQGRDPSIANAVTTNVGSDAVLDASATGLGAGGKVVVWSDQSTSYGGTILARGGATGGAGGAAEVSSGGLLSYAGAVDLRAKDGSAGKLLLDPSEVEVVQSGGSTTLPGGANPPAAASIIGADVIDTALLTSDVTISTHMATTGGDGVIEFNGGAGSLVFNNAGTAGRTLTFSAEQGFLFDTSVTTKGLLNLTLDANAAPITLPSGMYIRVPLGGLTLMGSDITLGGEVLGAYVVDLVATGAIAQTGGIIESNSLTGSSGGATSLTSANEIGFTHDFTAGGDLSINYASLAQANNVSSGGQLTLNQAAAEFFVSNASGATGITLNAANVIYLNGSISGPSISVSTLGDIFQGTGTITAGTLTLSAGRGISLPNANAVSALGAITNTTSGGVVFHNAGDFTLNGDIVAGGQAVSLVSNAGAITQQSGGITANSLAASAPNGINLGGANAVGFVMGLNSANVTGGGIDFFDNGGFTLQGDVYAPNQTVNLTSGGAISQATGSITAGTFSASTASGLNLPGRNQIYTVTSLSNSGGGGLVFSDNQSVTIQNVSTGGGDITLSATSGDLTLTNAIVAPGNLTINADGNITGTTATAAGNLGLFSGDTFSGSINFTATTVGGDLTASAVSFTNGVLQPTLTGPASNLNIDFTGTGGSTDLSSIALSAPGSVSLTAHSDDLFIGPITAGANVTLSTTGALSQGEGGGITAASLTASAVNGLNLSASNSVATVNSLTNTTSGSISFTNSQSVTIGAVNQGGGGSISLSTFGGDLTMTSGITSASYVNLYAANNLTVDGITAAYDINLNAGGALTEVPGGQISTGGSYSATALTMNAAAEQPVFTNTYGNLSLTFNETGSTIDLTGVPLSAPSSVSVRANNENLTVDSISAGSGDVTLYSGGVLAAAPGATINLLNTYSDSYNVTAVSMDLTNPSIVQPVFSAPTYGYLSLNLTQSGGAIDLTGAPLTAPQSVSVSTSGASLILDNVTSGGSVSLSSAVDLTVNNITAGGTISLSSGGVLAAAGGAAINVAGDYDFTTQTVSLANPVIVQPTFAMGSTGSLNFTFTQSGGLIDLSSTPLSAPGGISVQLASSDSNENLTVGSVTAGSFVYLYTGSYNTGGGALTIGSINAGGSVNLSTNYYYYSNGGPITSGAITAGGSVTASAGYYATSAFTFGNITAGDSVTLATGYYYGGDLTAGTITAGNAVNLSTGYYTASALTVGPITAGGAVSLQAGVSPGGVLTTDSITAGSDVTLNAGGALLSAPMPTSPVAITLGGNYSATGATIDPILFQPTFTMGSVGNLSLNFTGSGSTADLTGHPLTAPGSVSVSANSEALTVDSITAGDSITLFAGGPLAAAVGAAPVVMTLGGSYSATGTTIDPVLYQPTFTTGSTGNLNLTFNDSSGFTDLTGHPLSAPGSISITANSDNLTVDSLTAGADINLSAFILTPADVAPFAITLGGNYSATAASISPTLYQPTFTPGSVGSISLFFTGGGPGTVDLTGSPLNAPGSVAITAYYQNLTVDSITAGADVSLLATNGAVAVAPAATINLGGSYSVSASTIDPTALHPIFAPGTFGDLNLTYYGSGGADLTGSALNAPGSVSINALYENLTVDSITAGDGISLRSAIDLANASGAVMTLGGDYSASANTISTGLLQPTYTMGSLGSLSLTFNQGGASLDLSGTPFSAPGSVSITLNGSGESLTTGTITAGQDVNISEYYYGGTLTAGAIMAGGSVNLSTGYYTGGALTASTITAGGSVNLSTGYAGGATLTVTGPINAGGSVSMAAGQYSGGVLTSGDITATGFANLQAGGALTVGNTSVGGANFSASGGDLTLGTLSSTGSVSLFAGGNIVGASATGVTLAGSYSANGTTIDTRLYQPTFVPGGSGSLSLNFRQTGGAIDLTGFALTAPGSISVSAQENLTIDSLTTTGQVALSSSGALNQSAASVITAQSLSASATNGIVLNNANAVQFISSLNNSSTGGISFTNVGDINLDPYYYSYGPISASGQTVNLVSLTGAINGSNHYFYYPLIIAGTLTASAVTGVNLPTYNSISNLGPITNSTSGDITIGNGGDMTLVGDIAAPGQTVNLNSFYGSLNQTGGVITGNVLNASAETGISLNDANNLTTVGYLSTTQGGNGISFTNAGDFSLEASIIAVDQTVNLVSNAGAVTEGSEGVILARTLTGSAATGFHLDNSNQLTRLGGLSNTGSGGISFTNAGDVLLTGDVVAAGQSVSFTSQTGAVRQSTGAMTAGMLNVTAVNGVDIGGPNNVAQLGTITTGSGNVTFIGAGGFTLTNDLNLSGQSLVLESHGGAIFQTGGIITAESLTASAGSGLHLTDANVVTNLGPLTNGATGGISYTSAGDLFLSNDLNGFGQVVNLAAQTGAIGQATGEVITAGRLTASATNGINLGNANAIASLTAISNSGSGGVTLNDTVDLSVLGAVNASGQVISLTGAGSIQQTAGTVTAGSMTVSAAHGILVVGGSVALGPLTNSTDGGVFVVPAGDISLGANITAPGQLVDLVTVGGAITQTGGVITAGTLIAQGQNGVSLTSANQVANLSYGYSGTAPFTFNNAGDFAVTRLLEAPGNTVDLTSGGAISQTGDMIVASTLNVSAVNGIALGGDNLVANLGKLSNTTMGGIGYVSAGDPNLTGDISAPGQTVTLVAQTGGFNQTAGVITAGTLNVVAATGITLNDANAVDSIGLLYNSTSGGIGFTDAGGFAIAGQVLGQGQAVSLTSTSGAINQTAGNVLGDTVSLNAGAGYNMTGGTIQATTQATVTAANGDLNQTGGLIDAPNVTLNAAGAMNLADVTSSQTTLTATTLSLNPLPGNNGNALVAPTLVIESRSGQIDIGDNLNDPGFNGMTLSGATLNAFDTDTVSFYAGYFNPGARLTDLAPQAAVGIKVGDISTKFDGTSGVPGGATGMMFAGPGSTVEVLGSIVSKTPGNGHIIIGDATADAWTPKSIFVSGAIGASGTQLAQLNSIELNATNDVILGDSQFQQAIMNLEKSGQAAFINVNNGQPPGGGPTGTGNIFLGSNTLTLRAQGVIVSQNTGADGDFAGISLPNANKDAVALTLGTTLATPGSKHGPVVIDLFGTLNDSTGMAITGQDLAASTAIALETPLVISQTYRVNGCVIGHVADCKAAPPLVDTPVAKMVQGVALATGADTDTSDSSTESTSSLARTYAQTVLISVKPTTPVGDPTITGVGNEEIWRGPSCDPSGGAPCP